jgi:hypothetical protein
MHGRPILKQMVRQSGGIYWKVGPPKVRLNFSCATCLRSSRNEAEGGAIHAYQQSEHGNRGGPNQQFFLRKSVLQVISVVFPPFSIELFR